MGFHVSFAFKNLGRHRKRTVITALAIAAGLAVFLIADSLLQGADKASERNMVWYETGSLKIYSPEGAHNRDLLSLKYPLADSDGMIAALAAAGYTAVPRIAFQAELVLNDPRYEIPGSTLVRTIAIDPAVDDKVFPQREIKLEGSWPAAGSSGVVVGKWLAEDLGIKLGYPVSLSTRDRAGSYQVLDFDVVGILDSPNPNMNRGAVFVPLDVAREGLGMEGLAADLSIGLDLSQDLDAAKTNVAQVLSQASYETATLTWKELAPDYVAIASSKSKSSGVVVFLVFVIAAVGIGNTMLMTFYERKNEIATLRALGMDDRSLFWTFIAEAAGIGLIGSVIGLILGAILVALLVYVGLDFGSVLRQTDIGYRVSSVLYGAWVPKSFVGAAVLGTLLSAAVAVFPTRRSLRMGITEGLRVE